MAGRGDHKEDDELYDYLNRLGYEVGSLRFQMRNNKDCILSELLLAPPAIAESKAAETLHSHSEDDKPENLEREYFHHSLSDRILTDVINQCKYPVERALLCSEYLRELQKVESDLMKKVDEMCHRFEESFSQIIHSMLKRFLSTDETLLLFNELPSDNDSVVLSESSADEEVLPQSDLEESEDVFPLIPSDSDEEGIDIDAPGSSNVPKVELMKKGKVRTEVPDFIEYSGPSEEILEFDDHSPLALFSMPIMENVVFQTNLYFAQKGKNFSPLTQNDLHRLISINLAMGLKKMLSYRGYWSSCESYMIAIFQKL
ncbi:hypothetical protein AVEN_144443-1 [Araneus ventricosus]|uniref:PiggyBac transposable element-derived protein domain-containing protein n=1 Tax=Araneus ventricosus TaxID=182803 RepID=A0A4Y2E2X8_ARAVE|nr:hypothetical protein AVEN_144443-1 [Araneus ventricosus]